MESGFLTSLAFHGHGGRIPPLLGFTVLAAGCSVGLLSALLARRGGIRSPSPWEDNGKRFLHLIGFPWARRTDSAAPWFYGIGGGLYGVPAERALGKEGRYPIARSMGGQWKARCSSHWRSMGTADGFRRSLGLSPRRCSRSRSTSLPSLKPGTESQRFRPSYLISWHIFGIASLSDA